MAKSFGIVDFKLQETEYFLSKLQNLSAKYENVYKVNYYFNAFTSAARTLTFSIQACSKGIAEIESWYEEFVQPQLTTDVRSKYFKSVRDKQQHVGGPFIVAFGAYSGSERVVFYEFRRVEEIEPIKERDAIESSRKYFITLLKIVQELYINFGHIVDPEKYFSYENMVKIGKTVECFEEQLGYPKGYTKVDGVTDEKRVDMLRDQLIFPVVDPIFIKYLKQDRFGNSIE
jgi:hypothetical protein